MTTLVAKDAAKSGPVRAGLVLTSLILVAAVANLNLAVANVALPSIGAAFDASQTTAQPRSRSATRSAWRLGAVARRARRPLRAQDDAALGTGSVDPGVRCWPRWRRRIGVLIGARIVGGVSAGMAYPTTLALITALWAPAGAHPVDRPVVGHRRRRSPALGPLLSGLPARALLVGLGVPRSRCPLAVVAIVLAWRLVPAHVNESSEPVDNLGGVLSVLLVAR